MARAGFFRSRLGCNGRRDRQTRGYLGARAGDDVERVNAFILACFLCTLIALIAVVVSPYSEGQQSHSEQRRAEHHSSTNQSDQSPARQPDGTRAAPFVIEMIPSPKTAEERAQEAEDREEKKLADRWLVRWTAMLFFATVGLILATAVLGYFGFHQARDMKASISVAQSSADAAKVQAETARDTLKAMQDTARRQLRAYVHVDDATIKFVKTEWQPNIRITIKNFGQTPAYRVNHRCGNALVFIGKADLNPPQNTVTDLHDLGPSQDHVTTMLVPRVLWDTIYEPAIVKKAGVFHAFGEITYFDAFQDPATDRPHSTRYDFEVQADDEGVTDGGLIFSAEGNEAT